MAKLDLKAAYRNVPVHPEDRPLLGVIWENTIYIDTALSFGLRLAPKIFSAVADGVLWAMWLNGTRLLLHYLDDFIFFGQPRSRGCARALDIGIGICAQLGFVAHKIARPTTCLTFLGIEIDSVNAQLRLPADKLLWLNAELCKWHGRKSCNFESGQAREIFCPVANRLVDIYLRAAPSHSALPLGQSGYCLVDLVQRRLEWGQPTHPSLTVPLLPH